MFDLHNILVATGDKPLVGDFTLEIFTAFV